MLASKSRAAIYCKSVAFGDGLELCGSGGIGYYGNQHPGLLSPGGHASLQGRDVRRRGGAGRGSAQHAGETFRLSLSLTDSRAHRRSPAAKLDALQIVPAIGSGFRNRSMALG